MAKKKKKRSHFWVVSTHVLTTSFAFPCLGWLLGFAVIVSIDITLLAAFLLMLAFQALGYVGGIYYSLSYIKKVALIDNPKACVMPSIITFVVLAFLGLCFNLSYYAGEPAQDLNDYLVISCLAGFYVVVSVMFAKITKQGFASMESKTTDA